MTETMLRVLALFWAVYASALLISAGIAWVRNRMRMVPEKYAGGDHWKALAFLIALGIAMSIGLLLGFALLSGLHFLGGEMLVLMVSGAVALVLVIVAVVLKRRTLLRG